MFWVSEYFNLTAINNVLVNGYVNLAAMTNVVIKEYANLIAINAFVNGYVNLVATSDLPKPKYMTLGPNIFTTHVLSPTSYFGFVNERSSIPIVQGKETSNNTAGSMTERLSIPYNCSRTARFSKSLIDDIGTEI